MRALVKAGADPNALEGDRYDIVTIAAVANDVPTLREALALGCRAGNVTSRYDGTALIAAAHLGHAEVVRELIRAGAPLDHVNNLGWTALIESIVLGDGGPRHAATLEALVAAGANVESAATGRRDAPCARAKPRLSRDGRAAGEGRGALAPLSAAADPRVGGGIHAARQMVRASRSWRPCGLLCRRSTTHRRRAGSTRGDSTVDP